MASGYIDIPSFSGSGGGVSSINTLTGAITLAAGTNITLTPSGNTITIASTGGGGGVTTVGNFGTTPNSRGMTIVSTAINLQPANATNPGAVSIVAQTFQGPKTFIGTSPSPCAFTLDSIFNPMSSQNQPFLKGIDQNGNHNTALDTNIYIIGDAASFASPFLNFVDGNTGAFSYIWHDVSSGNLNFNPSSGVSLVTGSLNISANIGAPGGQWIIRNTGDGYFSSGSLSFDSSGNISCASISVNNSLMAPGNVGQSLQYSNSQSAPSVAGTGTPIGNYYGSSSGGSSYLSEPDSWAQITVNGNSYVFPLYSH